MNVPGLRRRWRRVLTLLALFLVSQVVWWTEPGALFVALERLAPNIVWRVSTAEPLVGLTFDDGPNPIQTPQVLTILRQHQAHATFFLIGERAAAHPELVAVIKAGGHEVGSHYLHRGTTLGDSRAAFGDKLARAQQIIGTQEPKLFRPPGGLSWPWQLREARERGYVCVLGSAYPHDAGHPPVGYIEWLVEKNMVPGSIIILHDGIADPSRTIEALPSILAEGQTRGIRFVTVGQLLKKRAGPPNKAMQLTKLRAAPGRAYKVPPCARAGQTGGVTASQLIASVRRT